MKKVVRILFNVLLFISLTFSLNGQTGKESGTTYGKGEDSIRCVRSLSLYRGEVRNSDYDRAFDYWKTVFDECPASSKNIYLDGVKIYKYFLDKEISPDKINELSDTLMLIYDRRIEYFNEKGSVRGRQGADLLKYRRNDGIEYVQQGYDYLKESLELEKEETSKAVLPTLVSASLTLYQNGNISDSQSIEDYLIISSTIDAMIEKRPVGDLPEIKKSIDDNFIRQGPNNCETLINVLTQEYESKSNNKAFLELLTNILTEQKCTESELFFTASKELEKIAPSAKSSANIALLALNKGEYLEAVDYYNNAINLETDPETKAEFYLGLAVAYQKADNKALSRQAALNAANSKPGYGDPYLLIGQLYAASKESCSDEKLPNAIYWIAVDMFNKAKEVDPDIAQKANELVSSYKSYFPKKDEAFFLNIYEGTSYTIGCWINETTKARFNE